MTSVAQPITPSRKTWRHFRLVRAEILKLRKRRGLVVTTGLLTVGAIVILVVVAVALHAANPGKYEPAGGVSNLRGAVTLITLLGSVAAIFVGCTAGAGDLGAGVFRELVVTGRSRLALFAARVPGGLAFLLALVELAYALSAVSAVVFANRFPVPKASTIAVGALWLVVPVAVWFAISLGLASLVGSRTTPIVILLPFNLIVSPLLAHVTFLGGGRDVFPAGALERLVPHTLVETPHDSGWPAMSSGTAVLVLVVWVCVGLAVGAWRTSTRDA